MLLHTRLRADAISSMWVVDREGYKLLKQFSFPLVGWLSVSRKHRSFLSRFALLSGEIEAPSPAASFSQRVMEGPSQPPMMVRERPRARCSSSATSDSTALHGPLSTSTALTFRAVADTAPHRGGGGHSSSSNSSSRKSSFAGSHENCAPLQKVSCCDVGQ